MTLKKKPKKTKTTTSPMPVEEIDQLIGTGFLPVKQRTTQHAPPSDYVFSPDRCRFLSGPPSRFVTERSVSDAVSRALFLHEEGLRLKAEKKAATLITLAVPSKRRSAFLRSLKTRTDVLRSFMVDELAMFELALATALTESKDEIEQLTGSTVEDLVVTRVQKAAEALVEMHAVHKLASTLGVSAEVRKQVLQMMGSSDGSKAKNVLDLQTLRSLLEARKIGSGEVRRMESTPETVVNGRRTPSRTRGLHST